MEKGNIVRVIADEFDLEGCQGEIVDIIHDDHEDGPIVVKFGKYTSLRFFGWPQDLEKLPEEERRIARFKEGELRIENDWDIKHKAEYHYPRYYHTLYKRVQPFTPGKTCELKGCDHEAVRRIVTNVWGSVCEYDVCEEHSDRHGCCMEILDIDVKIDVEVVQDVLDTLRHAL